MSKKPATRAEREHLAAIARMDCVICGNGPVDVHHIVRSGRRLGHYYTIPLCFNCHRGDNGFSGKNRSAWDKSLKNQLNLLAEVYMILGRPTPEYTTKVLYSPDSSRNQGSP